MRAETVNRRAFLIGATTAALGFSWHVTSANPLINTPTVTPGSPLLPQDSGQATQSNSHTSFVQDIEITWADGWAVTDQHPYENINGVKEYLVLERKSLLIAEDIVVGISITAAAVGVSPSDWIHDIELTDSQLVNEWRLQEGGEVIHREADDNVAWMTSWAAAGLAGLTVYRWPEAPRREWIALHVSFNPDRLDDIEVVNDSISIDGIPLLEGVDIQAAQASFAN